MTDASASRRAAVRLPAAAHRLLEQAAEYTTTCDGSVMVWRRWGSGRPVALLHGGSGSWTHWVRNIEALVDAGRSVWAPDLPGFGDSDLPTGAADATDLIEPLAAGMQQVLGAGPHEAVAFSFGSLVTTLLAAQRPALFARLLLVGLPILPLQHGRGVPLPSARGAMTDADRAAACRAGLEAIMIHDASAIGDDTVALQQINAARDHMRSRRVVTTDACRDAARALQCEFECVWGEQDALYRGRWHDVRAACDASPGCRGMHLIPASGHWVQYERAVLFNPLLLSWAQTR